MNITRQLNNDGGDTLCWRRIAMAMVAAGLAASCVAVQVKRRRARRELLARKRAEMAAKSQQTSSQNGPTDGPLGQIPVERMMYSSSQLALLANQHASESATTDIPARIERTKLYTVAHLSDWIPENELVSRPNRRYRTKLGDILGSATGVMDKMQQSQPQRYLESAMTDTDLESEDMAARYNQEISNDQVILMDTVRTPHIVDAHSFLRAGPRPNIVWKKNEVVAAIVTCGGLCPGINDVVFELVEILYYNYAVDCIYGINNGFRGFYDDRYLPYRKLTPQNLVGVCELGGTILGTSRGGFDAEKIIAAMQHSGINQLYVVGGDGTHRAICALFDKIKEKQLKIAVIGIPKTIDNDIAIIDSSFGFNTAVEEAQRAIRSARVEAMCAPHGVGIVKLMGRSAGFIAAHATLASREVDLCLIPEVPFSVSLPSTDESVHNGNNGSARTPKERGEKEKQPKPHNILPYLHRLLEKNGHAVIVVAEGAGVHVMEADPDKKDESGNQILPEVGTYLKTAIKNYFTAHNATVKDPLKHINVNVKYNDPSYMIRSVRANASDSVYCVVLAQNAVHGAMAGFSGFSSGVVNSRSVYIPIDLIVATSPTRMNPRGRTWERIMSTTGWSAR